MSNLQTDNNLQANLEGISLEGEFRSKWIWFVVLGAALLALGFLAFRHQFIATYVSVLYLGVLMMIGGAFQIIHAMTVKSWQSFFFWLLFGLVYAIAGYLTYENPFLASVTFTLFLGISLILAGVLRMVAAVQLFDAAGWGWVMASGTLTVIAGAIFILGWPLDSLWLLGLVLAVDLAFQGVTSLALGWTMRKT